MNLKPTKKAVMWLGSGLVVMVVSFTLGKTGWHKDIVCLRPSLSFLTESLCGDWGLYGSGSIVVPLADPEPVLSDSEVKEIAAKFGVVPPIPLPEGWGVVDDPRRAPWGIVSLVEPVNGKEAADGVAAMVEALCPINFPGKIVDGPALIVHVCPSGIFEIPAAGPMEDVGMGDAIDGGHGPMDGPVLLPPDAE